MDVCDDSSVRSAVSSVLQKSGAIDVLINNAGLVYVGAVEDLPMEDWRRQFETNFFGVLRVTQAVLPPMRAPRKPPLFMMRTVSRFVTPPTHGAYIPSTPPTTPLTHALPPHLA